MMANASNLQFLLLFPCSLSCSLISVISGAANGKEYRQNDFDACLGGLMSATAPLHDLG